MKTVETFGHVRELVEGSVGLVPTMGFFHEGHLSLIAAARRTTETVVVSIFVNPLQFGDSADLAAYPRDVERDAALARTAGTDVLFLPDTDTMYPEGSRTIVTVEGVSDSMEGAHRPAHFSGVATAVVKLFAGIKPDMAFFGRKDAQQLAVVRTVAADLSFPIEVHGLPIVREQDGLALSSRNVHLANEDRAAALNLHRALFAVGDAFEAGERSLSTLLGRASAAVDAGADIDIDYIEAADASDASTVERIEQPVFVAIAADIGGVRLIDNILLDPTTERADRGTYIDNPSILYGDA